MQRHLRWLGHGALALGLGLAATACDDEASTATADMMAAGGAGGAGAMGGAGGTGGTAGEGGAGGGGAEYDLAIPGMEGPATVRIDPNGFLHVQCATDNDCFRVEGYYHAAHRFAQMDLRRRVVRGQLSAIVTNIALPIDTQNRAWYADPTTGAELAEQLWEAATPETKAAVEAYAAGVNAWLAEFRAGEAELSDEYGYALIDRTAIRDWEPLDSAAAILALLDQLTNRTDLEIEIGALHAELRPAWRAICTASARAARARSCPTPRGSRSAAPWPWTARPCSAARPGWRPSSTRWPRRRPSGRPGAPTSGAWAATTGWWAATSRPPATRC